MTKQISDYVLYKRKRFNLIDTQKNLIITADFGLKETDCPSTACYRGYTAYYTIEDGFLSGVKRVNYLIDDDSFKTETKESEKKKMNYTGSILIALPGGELFNDDFIYACLSTDEAYELYFKNGKLIREIPLDDMIRKWREIEEKHISVDYEKFLKKHLKYKYCDYKWKTRG